MSFNNLSKTFRYVNSNGNEVIFDYANGYLISKPVGIDTLSVDLAKVSGINQVGVTVQSRNVQPRPVTVSGVLVGEFQQENKEKLLSVVRPDLDAKLYADDFYLTVNPTSTPIIEASPKFARFQFSLLAAYPYWRRDEASTAMLIGIEKRFKFPWNISQPYRFGEVVNAQFINIKNSGQVPIPYKVTFTALAGVTNPKLIDAESNDYLLVDKSMIAGERLVVEITHERTYVTSSVDGECRGALDLGSKFYRLAVGDNVIKPDATSGKSNMQVEIEYAVEVVGITL